MKTTEILAWLKDRFERATIQGIADYLLFGSGPERDERSYEESRMNYIDGLKRLFQSVIKIQHLSYLICQINSNG